MMEPIKNVLRSLRDRIVGLSGETGVSRRIGSSRWRSKRLLILCYHGISIRDEHHWLDQLFVTQDFLRRRFELIRDSGCHVLPLGEAVLRLDSGTLPERSVVLTFDDGFYNYLLKGATLIEEFGFPATNYVSTYYVQNQRPLLNLAVSYMLWRADHRMLAELDFVQQNPMIGPAKSADLTALQNQLLQHAEALSEDKAQQSAWLADIAGQIGVDWDEIVSSRILHLMDEQEIAQVAATGTDIQLHTHRHRTPDEKDLFVDELEKNRDIIQSITGQTATHFCYPSGRVRAAFLPWLRDLGVNSATTGYTSLARRQDDSMLLPRFVDTMHQSEVTFESWLNGVPDLLRPRSARR